MDEIMNGHAEPEATAEAESAAAPQGGQSPHLQDQLDAMMFPILHAPVRGIFTMVGGVPLDMIMSAICRSMGKIVGMATATGDLTAVFRIRAGCRKAFEEGIASVTPRPAPAMPIPGAKVDAAIHKMS